MDNLPPNYWSDWSSWYVSEEIARKCNLEPGVYLVKYNSNTGDLLLKHPDTKKERRINLYSILDSQDLNQEQLEALERLQKKNYKSLGGGYCNHHIIPHQLCKKSLLVRKAEIYGVFKKDGAENLMPLPYDFHKKNHTEGAPYYTIIQDVLEDQLNWLRQEGLDDDPDAIQQALLGVVETTRDQLRELMQSPGSTIRDDFPSPNYPDSWLS